MIKYREKLGKLIDLERGFEDKFTESKITELDQDLRRNRQEVREKFLNERIEKNQNSN